MLLNPWLRKECMSIYKTYSPTRKLQCHLLVSMGAGFMVGILMNVLLLCEAYRRGDVSLIRQEVLSLCVVGILFMGLYLGRHSSYIQRSGWRECSQWWQHIHGCYYRMLQQRHHVLWEQLSLSDMYVMSQMSEDQTAQWVYCLLTPNHPHHIQVWVASGCIDIEDVDAVRQAIAIHQKGFLDYEEVAIY